MVESIITNIGNRNIFFLINYANGMYAAVVLCRNYCVVNPLSVHTSISVDSEYG